MATAEDKRSQILAAAVRVFAAQGYEASRVGDVAREAGVAYGLVYHYFGSKDAVLEAVFREQPDANDEDLTGSGCVGRGRGRDPAPQRQPDAVMFTEHA